MMVQSEYSFPWSPRQMWSIFSVPCGRWWELGLQKFCEMKAHKRGQNGGVETILRLTWSLALGLNLDSGLP